MMDGLDEIPRLMIAGTGSGSGKTMLCCGLVRLLQRRGLGLKTYKCGPDYIDPMFLGDVSGSPCHNLDSFFLDSDGLCRLLKTTFDAGEMCLAVELSGSGEKCLAVELSGSGEKCLAAELSGSGETHLALIEGVMGYYDGAGGDGLFASSYDVAVKTGTPVVLVVNGKGSSTSILASIQGFVNFRRDSNIVGVILNMTTKGTYEHVKNLAGKHWIEGRLANLRFLGYVPRFPGELTVDSRHLGLVLPYEMEGFQEKIDRIADILGTTLDVDGIVAVAKGDGSGDMKYCHKGLKPKTGGIEKKTIKPIQTVKLAVARDVAFCFMYEDNLNLLRSLGAEIIFYSPIANEPVPKDACGLILSGGYPENHLDELSGARSSMQSAAAAVASGMPCIAECGGYMYLCETIDGRSMAGVLPGHFRNLGHLVRFGYVTIEARADCLLLGKGDTIKAHEFHYYDCDGDVKKNDPVVLTATRLNGRSWSFGRSSESLYAGFPHIYLPSNPAVAERFIKKCREYGDVV